MEPKSAWYVKEDASEDKPCGDFAWVEFSTSASEGTVWQCVPTSPVVPWEPSTAPGQKEKVAAMVFDMATERIEAGEPGFMPLGFQEAASRQPDNKKYKVMAWNGASGSSCSTIPQEDADAYKCNFCHSAYDRADKLANVDGNMGFKVSPDPFLYLVKIEMGVLEFQNMFTNPKVACFRCCQNNHNPDSPYFSLNEDGTIKLECKWLNKRAATMHINLKKAKLNNAFKNLAVSAAKKNQVLYTEEWMRGKYLAFQESGNQAAVDWVSKLNVDCHVIYYCVHCRTAPTAHNKWYRCTGNPLNLNKPGQFSGKCGHWRCAICLGKHKAEHREFMLFVIGDRRHHFIAFMGKSTPQNENKLRLLKTFKLLEKIGDAKISIKTIIAALVELQRESEAKFGCFPEVKRYLTQDPNKLDNVFGYSEHPCLSLMKAGSIIEAFDMGKVVVPVMTPLLVQTVIEICFACMDMGESPSSGLSKNQRRIWWEMAESPVKQSLRRSILHIETKSGLVLPLSSEDSGFEVVPLGCRRPPTHPPYSGALPCSSEDSGTEVVPCGCRGPPTHPPYPQEPLPPPVDEDEAPSVAPSSTSGPDWDVDEATLSDHAEHVVVPSTHTSANKIPRKS